MRGSRLRGFRNDAIPATTLLGRLKSGLKSVRESTFVLPLGHVPRFPQFLHGDASDFDDANYRVRSPRLKRVSTGA